MKKLALPLLLTAFSGFANTAEAQTWAVKPENVDGGYVTQRIELSGAGVPVVHLRQTTVSDEGALPAGISAEAFDDAHVQVHTGMDRKRAFAMVRIPLYAANGSGGFSRLQSYTLDVQESGEQSLTAGKTTGASSVLAAGNWYKIAVPVEGMYRVDYNFIKNTLGVDPASFAPSSIRVFGNGGAMLPEKVPVLRTDDLTENAIVVSDGGDGSFGPGDYFLFYAPGPMGWQKDSAGKRFTHIKHLYDERSYYFISFDQGAGLRISSQSGAPASNVSVTDFNDRQAHEEDYANPGKFGKIWWGENFSSLASSQLSRSFDFSGAPITDVLRVRMQMAVRSPDAGCVFTVYHNGTAIDNKSFGKVAMTGDAAPVESYYKEYPLNVNGTTGSTFRFDFSTTGIDAKGYLDYIEINTRRSLSISGGQLQFRDWNSVGAGKVAGYQLGGANGNTQVWDVTNPQVPVRMAGSLDGGTYTFSQQASSLHEFAAFDGSQFGTPALVGKVSNQNIHGNNAVDMVIVTHPDFEGASQQLAEYHRQHDKLRVLVVTPSQVYNEFSSGSSDITAIRDMMRLFYDRAGTDTTQMPRYLLLMGDASYDYKDRTTGNTNYVPTFEAQESIQFDAGYCADEYYAFLDPGEDIENFNQINTLDIGVGRLPVHTAAEATDMLNKIIMYHSPAALGPWRLNNTFVADDEDGAGDHLLQADRMDSIVNARTPVYRSSKVYLDNYQRVSTPGGKRAPEANKSINDQVFKGTFLINYSGHGNPTTLAEERIMTADDFNSWKNKTRLPIMITATCDFSRYDNPELPSAGEKIILKGNGGAIAMLTTTQAVYSNPNDSINAQFLGAQFTQRHGDWYTFGDAFRVGKNAIYSRVDAGLTSNFRKFILLGDPAVQPAFPKHFVRTAQMIEDATGLPTDTLKALGAYSVMGRVTNADGNTLSNFNGRLYVTIYDKPRTVQVVTSNATRRYRLEDNIVYKGNATVTNGEFKFSFIAPKDINYDFGRGRILYYAENGSEDAAGSDTSRKVGGFSDYPVVDNDAPIVRPFMNDTLFRNGAVTGSNTLLYVRLTDRSGINVSGSSVGHDLVGILDGNVAEPFILNDYYETLPNSYQEGVVRFPLTGLAEGRHSIRVKAWDVNNNSGEGTVDFVVGAGNTFVVNNLMNYPNPFTTLTHFIFEHNHPEEEIHAQIAIYNLAGAVEKVIDQTFTPGGSHSNEIIWDGTGNSGAQLASGMYPYRLILTTSSGIRATAYQKLVLIR